MQDPTEKRSVKEGVGQQSQPVSATGATILIVDDSPTELYVLKNILEKGGYTIISAGDGAAGVERALSDMPDLILMDVVMPGMNGFQATRRLSKNPKTSEIPVIMVTTKDQETDRTWAMRQGADDYLVKPVVAVALLHKVKSLLGS